MNFEKSVLDPALFVLRNETGKVSAMPAGSETIVTQGCSSYCGFSLDNSKGYKNFSETATASCPTTEKRFLFNATCAFMRTWFLEKEGARTKHTHMHSYTQKIKLAFGFVAARQNDVD